MAASIPSCSKPAANDATLPVPAITLDFNSGRLLTPARMAEIFPDYELTDPEVVPAPLIFGSGRIDAINLNEPLILRRVAGVWKFVEMPSLNHTAWVYAGASYERGELWAILDSTLDSSTAGLYLLRSTDHGATWRMFSGLKPPSLSAEFVEFSMDAKGAGKIIVHQDDDTDAAPRGLYAYATVDAGKTWTGPDFSPDDQISADSPDRPTLQETLDDLDGITPKTAPAPTLPIRPPLRPQPGFRGRGRGM
jgi:hypothetical protein